LRTFRKITENFPRIRRELSENSPRTLLAMLHVCDRRRPTEPKNETEKRNAHFSPNMFAFDRSRSAVGTRHSPLVAVAMRTLPPSEDSCTRPSTNPPPRPPTHPSIHPFRDEAGIHSATKQQWYHMAAATSPREVRTAPKSKKTEGVTQGGRGYRAKQSIQRRRPGQAKKKEQQASKEEYREGSCVFKPHVLKFISKGTGGQGGVANRGTVLERP